MKQNIGISIRQYNACAVLTTRCRYRFVEPFDDILRSEPRVPRGILSIVDFFTVVLVVLSGNAKKEDLMGTLACDDVLRVVLVAAAVLGVVIARDVLIANPRLERMIRHWMTANLGVEVGRAKQKRGGEDHQEDAVENSGQNVPLGNIFLVCFTR